jgi:hypothetical protein
MKRILIPISNNKEVEKTPHIKKREFDERLNEERQSLFILEAPDRRFMGQKTIRR